MKMAGEFGIPYRSDDNIMPLALVVGRQIDEVPFLIALNRVYNLGVDDRDVHHRLVIEVLFGVEQVTLSPDIPIRVSTYPVSRNMHAETLSLEQIQGGLPTTTVVDKEIGITIPIQIRFDVVFVVKQNTKYSVRVILRGPLFCEIPKLDFIGDTFIHQI